MNSTQVMPINPTKQNDYSSKILIGISLLEIALAISYTAISYLLNYDLLVIGFLFVCVLPVFLIVKFITQKKRINNSKKIVMYCLIAFILAFFARLTTRAVMVYEYTIIPAETNAEKEEGSYVSPNDVLQRIDKILKEKTGVGSYLGAFIWDLNHTTITTSEYGEQHSSQASVWEAIMWSTFEFAGGIWCVLVALPLELKKLGAICENCGNYKTKKFFVIGKSTSFREIKKAIQNKDLEKLKTLYHPAEANKTDFTSLAVWMCENCRTNGNVEIDLVVTRKLQSRQIPLRISFSPEQFSALKKILE